MRFCNERPVPWGCVLRLASVPQFNTLYKALFLLAGFIFEQV